MNYILNFLRNSMPLFEAFAKSTPSQIDDAVVEILKIILDKNGKNAPMVLAALKSHGMSAPPTSGNLPAVSPP